MRSLVWFAFILVLVMLFIYDNEWVTFFMLPLSGGVTMLTIDWLTERKGNV